MKTTLTLAAERLLMKSWNMLAKSPKEDMTTKPNAIRFEIVCEAFSAMLSASGHSHYADDVGVFLVESFQDEHAYNLKTQEFIQFQDEAFEDGVYKYHNPS